jgi:hypothetical protein
MKTHRSTRPSRAMAKAREGAKQNCEQALRTCEEAAAKVKSASDELAACWSTLGREISTGVSATELLRRRAWCNVLELRLKEKALALEEARHGVDAVWKEMLQAARGRDLPCGKETNEILFGKSWSLLMQSRPGALRSRTSPTLKH